MPDPLPLKVPAAKKRPPFECIALLLQGGGALGAYQAGVYQALSEADIEPDWVAGISIGAINAAIIAGNPTHMRTKNLRKFWELVTTTNYWEQLTQFEMPLLNKDTLRSLINQGSAASTLMNGVDHFFKPRTPTPWLNKTCSLNVTSYYDTTMLKSTLEELIDFDRLNSGIPRLSVGAVNVATGNLIYFDTTTHKIGPEHIMASGALPPAFPAVEIDGEFYWDGGLVTNTPLQWVADGTHNKDTLAFQVDLWSADGAVPQDMAEVMTRQKEIQFSSRTRANTDRIKNIQKLRFAFANLYESLPDTLKNSPEAKLLKTVADRKVSNIVHLIYHTKNYEGDSKDYEFSRLSMKDHWQAGYHDALQTLSHPEVLERPPNNQGIAIYDFSRQNQNISNAVREAAE